MGFSKYVGLSKCLMQLEPCCSFDLDMHFMDVYALIQMSIFCTALISKTLHRCRCLNALTPIESSRTICTHLNLYVHILKDTSE